ncbi:unnamed protein product [Arabidopsis thaliana]|uniref:(thale cress) hypothetical protein n=1 Tax=Arabidopsis thaliana TaxID=3702 RepID=A0A7G2FGZ0_ARATH|nr:unnamed protein product [Arabidopsis thaliana]
MDQQSERVKQFCNHPLRYARIKQEGVITGWSNNCDGCGDDSGYGYYCERCNIQAHVACIGWPDIINHPCHSRHPLKKVSPETIDYTDDSTVVYACSRKCAYRGHDRWEEWYSKVHCE